MSETASTPQMWADNFARSKPLNRWKAFRLRRHTVWKVIRKYVPRGARMLDAGCGNGDWVMLLRHDGWAAEGLDYSPELVQRLRERYPDVAWYSGDVRNMPLPDAAYDALYSLGVIEHDPDGPQAALREYARVLKPGGIVVVTVPRDTPRYRAASQIHFPRRDGAFFQYFMTERELANFVGESFEVVEVGVIPYPALPLLAPTLYQHHGHKRWFRVAAFAFSIVMRWTSRYDGNTYCVGRRRA